MARFRAFASDDDSASSAAESSRSPSPPPPPRPAVRRQANVSDDEDSGSESEGGSKTGSGSESGSDSSTSHMSAQELARKPGKQQKLTPTARKASATTNGRTRRPTSPSSSRTSSSSPPPTAQRALSQTQKDTTIIPWAQHVGVDAQKMHVMQTSLFRMPEEAAALKAMANARPDRKTLKLTLNRKHSRDSEGDAIRVDSRERSSFARTVDPAPFRPSRKYMRVESSDSATAGYEGAVVDAGLALGRSFRVGWGPGGVLTHPGSLCHPSKTPKTSNASAVTKTPLPFFTSAQDESKLQRLLQHHLTNSPIVTDADGIPFADPSTSLDFASLAALYPSGDRSYEASLFRLAHALFDKLDVHLPPKAPQELRDRATAIRRKTALSAWLADAVAPAVDYDLSETPNGSAAALAFVHLTGHRIAKAVEAAADGGNPRLATLLAQAGSGDPSFRADIQEQLDVWREERIDCHIPDDVRRIYALMAGIVDVLGGSQGKQFERCADLNICEGLDWKRTFGLHLWYRIPLDGSIASAVESYEQAFSEDAERSAPPRPWYQVEAADNTGMPWARSTREQDALFHLIKLHSDPSYLLSDLLKPKAFGPSPVDFCLPWHLYIIFSRSLDMFDTEDRGSPGSEEEDMEPDSIAEGHSPSADTLASSYAQQLEQRGMIQEAVFVLLHVEGPAGRKRAIKDLLMRSAPKLDEWQMRGLVGSLKIPISWVHEAKAVYALDNDDLYEAYKSYLAADIHNAAHDLAVLDLAPEAVICQDLKLLRSLFQPFERKEVEDWHTRGKVFIDYAHVLERGPELRGLVHELADVTVPDASQNLELDDICRSITKLLGILPDVLPREATFDARHKAALAEMTSRLMRLLDDLRPLAMGRTQIPGNSASEGTRLHHVQSASYARFLESVEDA